MRSKLIRIALAVVVLAGAYFLSDGARALTRQSGILAKRLQCRMTGKGFNVTYYRGTNFSDAVCARVEPLLFRDYGEGAPAIGVPHDHFCARWEAWVICPNDAEYRFFSQSDDGLEMRIDDQVVLSAWRDQAWLQSGTHGKMRLEKGPHHLVLDYYDGTGAAALRVKWAGGGVDDNTVMSAKHVRLAAPQKEAAP